MIRKAIYLCLVLPLALLWACGEDEPETPRIESSQQEVLLRSDAAARSAFTVTATGAWTLSTSGSGYVVSPTRGERGETRVSVTAEAANTGRDRLTLGSVTLRLTATGAEYDVKITQSPAIAPRTVLMYLPWSGPAPYDLTADFRNNIADMESIVAEDWLGDERLLVYFMEAADKAELFEVYHDNGTSVRKPVKVYDEVPAFTTPAGIASILEEVKKAAPAQDYAMTIGCHGMAWLPARGSLQIGSSGPGSEMGTAEKEYWEYAGAGRPMTRWFGGSSVLYQTDIADLAAGITAAGMTMEYILLDDCYMSSIEVAYELREVTRHLIGSTSEIMAYGFPYAQMGHYMFGKVDYAGIGDAFYDFYMAYPSPYGTIGVTVCSELEALAAVMARINADHTFDSKQLNDLQALDGYTPTRFFDLGDYVRHLCGDQGLLSQFEEQLARTVPPAYHRHTPQYYSMTNGVNPIRTYSGITTSDPSTSGMTNAKKQTAWWKATHPTGE